MSDKPNIAYHFMSSHPVDAARVMERQETDGIITLLQDAPPATAAEILRQMDDNVVSAILDQMETDRVTRIMECFPVRTASVLLRRMEKRETILSGLLQDMASDVRQVIQYSEGTAGALMDPRVFTVTEDVKIGDVLATVRRHPDFIKDYLYVVSRDHILVGVCSLSRMLSVPSDQPAAQSMQPPQQVLSPYMTYQAVLDHPGWKLYHDLPVVDADGVFLGVISYRAMRQMEGEKGWETDQDAGTALGELYWLGLSAFVKGAGTMGSNK